MWETNIQTYVDEHVQGSLNLNCYHFFSVPFLFLDPQFPPPPLLFKIFIWKSDVLVSLVHSRELRILDLGFSWGGFQKPVFQPWLSLWCLMNFEKRFLLFCAPLRWADYKPRGTFNFKLCKVGVEIKYQWQVSSSNILKAFGILIHQGNTHQNCFEITSHPSTSPLETSLEVS